MAGVTAHLFITGRVQGVFFRSCTREEARKRRLTGWVRNLPDGRVETVLEGEETAVQSMINWCYSGPPHASVTDVSLEVVPGSGRYPDFTVRY